MSDQDGYITRIIQAAQQPGSFAVALAQAARQVNAAQSSARVAQGVAQVRNAAADVRFEQMIVNIERFALLVAINGMIEYGWSQNKYQQSDPESLYPVAVRKFKRIGSEAAGIRDNLRSLMKLTNVDSSQKVMMSKMKSVMDSSQRAVDVNMSFIVSTQNKTVDIDTYLRIFENMVTIARLGRIQGRILDTHIGNWSLPAAVQNALTDLAVGETDRVQREPRLKKLYYEAGDSFDVVRDQGRAVLEKLSH